MRTEGPQIAPLVGLVDRVLVVRGVRTVDRCPSVDVRERVERLVEQRGVSSPWPGGHG
jgi:hypothetical protein